MQLDVRDIGKIYPAASAKTADVTALVPTSFSVSSGEFLCLLGPSGCGKSTLLYMLAGLEEPSGGEILLDGEAVAGPGRERGLVFQNYTLFPWLTVEQNAAFSNRLSSNTDGLTRGETYDRIARVEFLLDLMGLSKFKNAHPRELSGGMKQRVAIARTLVNRPKLMLMDEPFGALDSQTREEMQELLLLISEHEKTTVIFVTHDVDEAIFLGSRILVFSARPGRVIADVPVPFEKKIDFSLKMEPEFFRMKRELLDLLHAQADGGGARNESLAKLIALKKSGGK
ncbi:MAG: ABC transporter ATP-binding protein [bacterium]|nr:ABC transporter ATP-binding protein [bacterium]